MRFRLSGRHAAQRAQSQTAAIPFATFDDGSTAHWDTGIEGGPHCLITGHAGSGRTMVIRTIAEQLARRRVSTVFIGWRPTEHIRATETFVCGTITGCDPDGLLRAARAIRSIADERVSRRRRARFLRVLRRGRPRPLIVIIDDGERVLGSWLEYRKEYRSGHAISRELNNADPLEALESLLALGRAAGVSVCLSVHRPFMLDCVLRMGSLRDTFGTRCALGVTSCAASAQLLWDDHLIRYPYTADSGRGSVGRAFVTHPVNGVAAATVTLTALRADALSASETTA